MSKGYVMELLITEADHKIAQLKKELKTVKADAIREAVDHLVKWSMMNTFAICVEDLLAFADKLESNKNATIHYMQFEQDYKEFIKDR